jgi:hypothetical protein
MDMARDLAARVSSVARPDPCRQDRRLDSEHLRSTGYRSPNLNKLNCVQHYKVNFLHISSNYRRHVDSRLVGLSCCVFARMLSLILRQV